MNLRERLADWLTDGQYGAAKIQSHRLENYFAPKVWAHEEALEKIVEMETPNANATVKRMAKIAKDALK